MSVPQFLIEIPRKVLFGQARGIEKWCKAHGKCAPTLLDLSNARQFRRSETPARNGRGK